MDTLVLMNQEHLLKLQLMLLTFKKAQSKPTHVSLNQKQMYHVKQFQWDYEDAVLMDGVVVKAGAVVKRCILAEDVVVGAGAKVGGEGAIAHVGTGLTIGAGATVKEGAKVFESVKEGVEVC